MGLRTLSAEFPAVPISEHEEIKIRLGEQIEANLSYFHCRGPLPRAVHSDEVRGLPRDCLPVTNA